MTVRRRDTSEVGVPSRFRPSFFLLFEASDGEKGAKPGLMDDDDKLKIASLFKNVLTARVCFFAERLIGSYRKEAHA